jgi:putative ABC transport system permease protein
MKLLVNVLSLVGVAIAIALLVVLPWPGLLACVVAFAAWMTLTRAGRLASSVTGVGLTTLKERAGSSTVTVIGIAGVVAVLVALLAMADGYRDTLRRTGGNDTALVLRGASAAEAASVLDRDSVVVIEQAPGIARNAAGKPIVSPELVVAANLPLRASKDPDELGSVQLRGIGEQAWELRSQTRIIAGRTFASGTREVVIGKGAQRQFANLEPGREIRLGAQTWTVVGVFASGDAFESEMWADAAIVGPVYRRGASVTSVSARLTSPAAFEEFKRALTHDPRLQVDVITTAEYFSKRSEGVVRVITVVGMVVGAIMAIGAVFGALNTMFATVASRAREIAMLRAIGFGGTSVVVAVMLETMLLALGGGILGGLLAWLVFNGYTASTMGGGAVGQLTFQFKVTAAALGTGLKWALAIGMIGGLFPALRAARLPLAAALRAI